MYRVSEPLCIADNLCCMHFISSLFLNFNNIIILYRLILKYNRIYCVEQKLNNALYNNMFIRIMDIIAGVYYILSTRPFMRLFNRNIYAIDFACLIASHILNDNIIFMIKMYQLDILNECFIIINSTVIF